VSLCLYPVPGRALALPGKEKVQRHHTNTQPILTMPGRDCSAQPDRDTIKTALDSVFKSDADGEPVAEVALDVADDAESQAIAAAHEENLSEDDAPPLGSEDESSGWEDEPPIDLSKPGGVRAL
jgi:hypothetical protein